MGPNGDGFFKIVADEVTRRGFVNFKSKEAAKLLWAMAVSGEDLGQTFETARADLEDRDKARLNPVDMSNIAWAFAQVSSPYPNIHPEFS